MNKQINSELNKNNKRNLIISNILFWTGLLIWNNWLYTFIEYGFLTISTMVMSSIVFLFGFYNKEIINKLNEKEVKHGTR